MRHDVSQRPTRSRALAHKRDLDSVAFWSGVGSLALTAFTALVVVRLGFASSGPGPTALVPGWFPPVFMSLIALAIILAFSASFIGFRMARGEASRTTRVVAGTALLLAVGVACSALLSG